MTKAKCPICSKPSDAKLAPFCSRRCADVDLSRWLKGGYAIPGRPVGEEDEEAETLAKTARKAPEEDPD